jgi:hypothetical protein
MSIMSIKIFNETVRIWNRTLMAYRAMSQQNAFNNLIVLVHNPYKKAKN